MRSRLRALASALLLQAMLFSPQAAAAPVLQGDATPSPVQAGLLADPAPENDAGEGTPTPERRNPAATAAEQAARSQALDEAGVAATKPTLASPSAARTAAGIAGDGEIDPDLKEVAKEALQWAHEAKQMVLPASPGTEQGIGSEPGWASDSRPRNIGGGVEYSLPSQQAPASGRSTGGGLNLVEEAIELVKEITGHPITWLLMPIVAFGGAAALVMRYRPHLEKRWRYRRAVHRRLGSSDPTRKHRHHHHHHHHQHGTAAGTQGPPLPAHRSAKASERSRGHRSSKPRRTA